MKIPDRILNFHLNNPPHNKHCVLFQDEDYETVKKLHEKLLDDKKVLDDVEDELIIRLIKDHHMDRIVHNLWPFQNL